MQPGKPSRVPRRVAWAAAAVLVVAALAFSLINAVLLPGCESCHTAAPFRAATAAAPHAKVDCRACHVAPGLVGRLAFSVGEPFHMSAGVIGGARRDAASVPDSRCLVCHEDIMDGDTISDGLRITHKSCAAGASCSDCHSATAHGEATSWLRVYEMDQCLACHVSQGRTKCDLCHEGRDAASRIESPTFRVTHGAQWRTTHGMGDGSTCVVCHGTGDCVQCHGPGVPHGQDFVQLHPRDARRTDAKCDGCHDKSFCDSCHGTPMPHSKAFTKGHAKSAGSDPDLCKRCHAAEDCTVCHDKHVHPGGVIGGTVNTLGGGD